jgi:hypothetical protein
MTAIKRTCATCVAFNPSATEDEVVCGNLVSIVIHHVDEDGKPLVIYREPYPNFRCDSHKTHAEDVAEDAAIAGFWLRLGIEPRRGDA